MAAGRRRFQPSLELKSGKSVDRGTRSPELVADLSEQTDTDLQAVYKPNSLSSYPGYRTAVGRRKCQPSSELKSDRSVDQRTKSLRSEIDTSFGARHRLTGILQAEQSVFVPSVQGGGGSTQVPAFPGADVWQICWPGHYPE